MPFTYCQNHHPFFAVKVCMGILFLSCKLQHDYTFRLAQISIWRVLCEFHFIGGCMCIHNIMYTVSDVWLYICTSYRAWITYSQSQLDACAWLKMVHSTATSMRQIIIPGNHSTKDFTVCLKEWFWIWTGSTPSESLINLYTEYMHTLSHVVDSKWTHAGRYSILACGLHFL